MRGQLKLAIKKQKYKRKIFFSKHRIDIFLKESVNICRERDKSNNLRSSRELEEIEKLQSFIHLFLCISMSISNCCIIIIMVHRNFLVHVSRISSYVIKYLRSIMAHRYRTRWPWIAHNESSSIPTSPSSSTLNQFMSLIFLEFQYDKYLSIHRLLFFLTIFLSF